MGISYPGARILWGAKARGVRFDETLTLGHLSLRLFRSEVAYFRRVYKQANGTEAASLSGYTWGTYVDDFVREFLGASDVDVLDASPYQGATTIHDLNEPVPEDWHQRYDAIIDGGTLEHIFNVPTAFANVANMLKIGGTVFINAPANNLMGHGFYQFSPEFMFRVFSQDNGFDLKQVLLYEAKYPGVELTRKRTVFKVVDPDDVHRRVGLLNTKPVMMMVEATKVRHVAPFAAAPLQSDYVASWKSAGNGVGGFSKKDAAKRILRSLPSFIRAPVEGYRQKRAFNLDNKQFYTRQRWATRK